MNMLCTLCQHGVDKKKTWDCAECGETYCSHIRICDDCSLHRREVTLRQLIVAERDRQLITNSELAARMKLHPQQVSRELKPGYEMGIDQARRYATALGVQWHLS